MNSPRGNDNDLRYAIFTLKEDNIPQSLNIPSSLLSVVETPLKSYNFEKELNIITNYEELKRQEDSDKRERVESITLDSLSISSNTNQQQEQQQQNVLQQQSPVSSSQSPTQAQVENTIPLSARGNIGNEIQSNTTATGIVTAMPTTIDTKSAVAQVVAQVAIAPVPPPKPTKEHLHESAILSMMQQTKQERNVCMFYLDSMNWDLQAALSMYFEMMEQTNS